MKDGILIINKPSDMTSHDVVAIVRKKLKTKKVGHTGTLDPLATGVLVICIEKATKLVDELTSKNKTYEVEMKLGIKTTTGDITGSVVNEENNLVINPIQVVSTINSFIGKQKQIPPMYSAIKVDGQKLYELARKGIEIERKERDIEIFSIENISIENDIIKYTVECSKGTYIRVLCEDIAKRLGTFGVMTSLRRIRNGEFKIEDAVEIDEISEEKIMSIEKLFDKKIEIGNNEKRLVNGEKIPCNMPNGIYKIYINKFIGIGEIRDNFLKRKIIL